MGTIFLVTPGTTLSVARSCLRVELPSAALDESDVPAIPRDIPVDHIDQLVLSEEVSFSTDVLAQLLWRRIPVIMVSRTGRICGLCVPPAPHSAARLAQYRAANDLQARLRYASWWVEAKIANAARVLQRLASNRSGISAAGAVTGLRELTAACRDADTLDGIRGYEGAAAALYFETLDSFFPPDCPFERRSRRPPHNAANAVLSFAYAILGAEMEGGLYAAGLDPALGLYHETEDRRPALALDFIEPLRPPVADALALDLLNHGILKADLHFEARDGGVYMNRAGRRRFFIAYERRMTQDFFSEQLQRRTSIRGELRRQAIEFKQSLLEGGAFRPFRMN